MYHIYISHIYIHIMIASSYVYTYDICIYHHRWSLPQLLHRVYHKNVASLSHIKYNVDLKTLIFTYNLILDNLLPNGDKNIQLIRILFCLPLLIKNTCIDCCFSLLIFLIYSWKLPVFSLLYFRSVQDYWDQKASPASFSLYDLQTLGSMPPFFFSIYRMEITITVLKSFYKFVGPGM